MIEFLIAMFQVVIAMMAVGLGVGFFLGAIIVLFSIGMRIGDWIQGL